LYLKSLDIQGFKSFPDKLHLDFHKGMTAIVGPNGSGKSNIADAIRWVLGEQSTKTLRGSKMEDVIFAGAQSRKAVGYAEVSLTLDNSEHTLKTDYTEVMITRRFYRSGESEFYINKKSVRLKDIHELFMDTGLGRDGYSIIGQGRIDEILSVRSDDRREVFDEAAGITKFRYRRDEAMKRLDAANENLVRVNDIISTLSEQLEPMRIKAEKEKKYNTLFGELKSLEISLWMNRLEELKEEYDKLAGERNIVAYASEECKQQIESTYRSKEILTENLITLEKQQDELRQKIRESESERALVVSGISLKEAEISRNDRDMERLQDEAADYEQRRAAIERTVSDRTAEIEGLEKDLSVLADEIRAYEAENTAYTLSMSEKNGRLYGLRENEMNLQSRLGQCRIVMSSLDASCAALTQQIADVDIRGAADRATFEDAREKIVSLENSIEEKQQERGRLQNMVLGYRMKIESRRKKYDEAKLKYEEYSRRLQEDSSRLKILSDLERDYDGFNRSVKLVMRDADNHTLRGIHGPVSKLMRVDERYVVAAETALGSGMQNIVVDREEDAKSAIEMLKRRDGGRATFLPISAVRGTELDDRDLRRERGFVGVLSRLVSYDADYEGIFRSLLGRTAVCETLDAAISLARKNGYKFRIVTLDGQVLNAGGAMTGGSQNKSFGILSRANEIQRLASNIETLKSNVSSNEEVLRTLEQDLNAATYSLDAAETERVALETELAAMDAQLTERKDNFRLMEDSLKNADAVKAALTEKKESILKQIAEKRLDETALLEEETGLQASISALQEEISALSSQITKIGERLQQSRTQQQEKNLSIGAAQSAIRELKERLESVDLDKSTRLAATKAYQTQNALLADEIKEAKLQCDTLDDSLASMNSLSSELTEQKMRIEADRVKNERQSQELNQKSLNLERELLRFENQIENVSRDQDTLTTKLWDNYELTRTTAKEFCISIDDYKSAQKRADELRRGIKALGNISPGSIEEYTQASEKYEFLTAQREDIEVSQKSLTAIIDELTVEMKSLFSKQFKIINEIFGETFVELFGGGHAHLELSEPGDVLGSGIEIKVQPPGKALKVLSLLSGGEKAFVAIALYFAILKVRPTPFCVLDEIEAALDDVNVMRYAKYLKQFEETQFIVITHRRGTMEEADVLYGVAMPTQGVSKVLSLDISSVERELNMKL